MVSFRKFFENPILILEKRPYAQIRNMMIKQMVIGLASKISPTYWDLYELRRRNFVRNCEARKILVLKSYQIGKHWR